MIFLDYIGIPDIYLNILKSPQKHFINTKTGQQNQVSQYFFYFKKWFFNNVVGLTIGTLPKCQHS